MEKRFSAKYDRELIELKNKLLGNAALILVRVKCISNDNWRYFLMLVFPPSDEGEGLPKVLIYHDDRCAYCGSPLTITKESAKCIICRNEFGEEEKIVCVNGHYICDNCYDKEAAKPLAVLSVEGLLCNYDKIKEKLERGIKEGLLSDLELEIRRTILFRNIILSLLEWIVNNNEKLKERVEIIPLTNIIIPDYMGVITEFCMKKCENKCPTVRKVLEVVNSFG